MFHFLHGAHLGLANFQAIHKIHKIHFDQDFGKIEHGTPKYHGRPWRFQTPKTSFPPSPLCSTLLHWDPLRPWASTERAPPKLQLRGGSLSAESRWKRNERDAERGAPSGRTERRTCRTHGTTSHDWRGEGRRGAMSGEEVRRGRICWILRKLGTDTLLAFWCHGF